MLADPAKFDAWVDQHNEQALVIAREIGDRRGERYALWNMSVALDRLGDRTQAIAHAEAALKDTRADRKPPGRNDTKTTDSVARGSSPKASSR